MRILMVIPQAFYSTRGTPLSAYHRTKDLLELSHEVEILTYPVGDPPPGLDVRVHRSAGPHFVKRIKQGPSYIKIWFDLLLFANLVYRLLRKRYDAIYAHEEGAFIYAMVSPLFRVPLIYDMHSSLPLQISDWEFSKSKLVVDLFRWIERVSIRRAVAVIAISPGVARAAKEAHAPAKVITIVNRFELDERANPDDGRRVRRELGIEPDRKVVLYTGSFVALQALDLLIHSIPKVAARVPGVQFVLVGGRQEEIDALSPLADGVGATPHLRMLLARPQSEMPAFMEASDVLVSPRIKGINPPGKLFSYLSSERPVVATDCPIHNQLLDQSFAILTRPDAESFADGIVRALVDQAYVRRLIDEARRVLAERFNPEANHAAYRELFRALESSTTA
jgi:glycosyltransferase involved in cell wall biosynthesis